MKTLKNYLCAFSILFAVGELKSGDQAGAAATEGLTSSMVGCTGCLTLQRRIDEIESRSGIGGMSDSGIFSAIGDTEAQLRTATEELKTIKAQLIAKTASVANPGEEDATLQEQILALQASLTAEKEKNRELVEEAAESQRVFADNGDKKQIELEALSARYVRLQSDFDALHKDKKELEETNTEQSALILTLQDGNRDLIRQIDVLRQQFVDLETEMAGQASLEQGVVAVQLSGQSLSAELAQATAGSALPTIKDQAIQTDQDAEIADAQARIVELEKANQALAAEKEKLLEAMEAQAKELLEGARKNKEAFEGLNASIKELRKENEQLRQDQVGGQSLSAELAKVGAGSALPIFKHQEIQTDQDAEIADAQARIKELEVGLTTARAQPQPVLAVTPAAEASVEALQAKDAEIARAQARIREFDCQVNTLARQFAEEQKNNRDLQAELAAVRASNSDRRAERDRNFTARAANDHATARALLAPTVTCWKRWALPAFTGALVSSAITYGCMKFWS